MVDKNHMQMSVVRLGRAYESLNEQALSNLERILWSAAGTADLPCLVLDFSNTAHIGCGFLDVLLRCYEQVAQRGGRLALCVLHPNLRGIIQVTRLDRVWDIYETYQDAKQAMSHELHVRPCKKMNSDALLN